jgi:hypothetical protein
MGPGVERGWIFDCNFVGSESQCVRQINGEEREKSDGIGRDVVGERMKDIGAA